MTENKELRHIASVFILDEKDRVLIIRRAKNADKNPNLWEDDTYLDAAVREAQEEVGLKVSDLIKLDTEEYYNRIKHFFVTDQYKGSVIIVKNPLTGVLEHSDFKWATLEDIKSLKQQSRVSVYLMEKAIKIIRGKE